MTPRIRHKVVGLLLAVLIIWPLVQQQLVLRYRVSPWKLAGWAMYTTVMPRGNMALTGIDASGRRVSRLSEMGDHRKRGWPESKRLARNDPPNGLQL